MGRAAGRAVNCSRIRPVLAALYGCYTVAIDVALGDAAVIVQTRHINGKLIVQNAD
ncbi:MAG: hypothetical protein QS748_11005 [Candidatus Endonucleobacter bathymodioli]|uniref:Uncharacterized protein n=1 Tax=Candidatus Endonucleibacter bathymodioli TaxID=539814 RepID=A0AA90NMV9_9GAMM|nr:hypothetical protein [Candidatus Endonucleobacter bathymodioli]